MEFNNKKILSSINILAAVLNSSGNSIEQVSESNLSSEENSQPTKTIILKSKTPISSYSKNFITDLIRDNSCQGVVTSVNHATSPQCSFTSDSQVQTYKLYHQYSRKTQTRNPAKKRLYSRKIQTDRQAVESIRETIQRAYPKSPLLALNKNRFSRLVTGKFRTPFDQESIIKGFKMQCVSGNRGYKLLRSEIPDVFPSKSTICKSLSSFYILPGPIKMVIYMFSNKLAALPSYNKKIVLCFDEFSISPKVEFSKQHNSYIGFPTLKPQYADSTVQNCLIIIAQCLTLPIRVPVSVDFTTSVTKAGILYLRFQFTQF